ncbi:putative membrane protein [Waddlia chondrophila 2032/99]|uniref:Putative membrane protein n=3 Tax=Waddlia chondrophila TaxID=71667 RepID=D6YT50_WADCW|nr:putative membrane protein [Waddlia chondrophila WSU 86-1044]CCB91635.1 putative membrane protein [Waddlia chondrophila 2032/99]
MIVRRRFLTLIEMLIVVSILLFVSGVIGFNIRRALMTQRFNTETALFVDSIRLAQDMMLILSRDVYLKVRPWSQDQGMEYFIEVEGGVPKEWESVIKRSHRVMESVHYISFERQDSFPSQPGMLELRFQSRGSMMSKGELRFSSHEDPFTGAAMRRAVCLRGHPQAITSQIVSQVPFRGEMWTACKGSEEDENFFKQLTAYMVEEVLQDQPKKSGSKAEKNHDQTQ